MAGNSIKKRCVLVVPDSGPFITLEKVNALHLLLELKMPIIVIDAIYYELIINPDKYDSDRHIRDFIKRNAVRQKTEIGEMLLENRLSGKSPLNKHMGEAAIAEFLNNDLENIAADNPVLLLFEDHKMLRSGLLTFPSNVHLVSTIGLLRGLEEAGIILSAEDIIKKVTEPPRGRCFPDLPEGTDIETSFGSRWKPDKNGEEPEEEDDDSSPSP